MAEDNETKGSRRRGIAAGLGLTGAGLLAGTPSAQAAMEVAQVADNDARLGVLAFIFLPALAWVAFNIAGGLWCEDTGLGVMHSCWCVCSTPPSSHTAPAKNQLDKMSQK